MYSTQFCPYCVMAEKLLLSKGADKIEKVRIDLEPERRTEMLEKTGRRTVPQIYIGETHVGGYDDLAILNKNNELTKLLAV
jgi:glutaredoxin 3